MPFIDPILAKELAQAAAAAWHLDGRQIAGDLFRVFQDACARPQALDPAALNVQIRKAAKGRESAGSSNWARVNRDTLRKDVSARAWLPIYRDVIHLRPDGRFRNWEWTVTENRLWCRKQTFKYEAFSRPVTFDQHLLARWVQRTGDQSLERLLSALPAANRLAMLHLAAANQGGRLRMVAIAVPVPGGCLLGGTELVWSQDLGRGVEFRIENGTLHSMMTDQRSTIFPAASIRTFLAEDQLNSERKAHLADLRAWLDEHETNGAARETAERSLADFAALAERTQELFPSWRRRMREIGFADQDFTGLREHWRERHGEFVETDEARDMVSEIVCVPSDEVRIVGPKGIKKWTMRKACDDIARPPLSLI